MFKNIDDSVALLEGISIQWSKKDIGVGRLCFYQDSDGVIHCASECMSPTFVLTLLNKMIDEAVWDDFEGGQYNGKQVTEKLQEIHRG